MGLLDLLPSSLLQGKVGKMKQAILQDMSSIELQSELSKESKGECQTLKEAGDNDLFRKGLKVLFTTTAINIEPWEYQYRMGASMIGVLEYERKTVQSEKYREEVIFPYLFEEKKDNAEFDKRTFELAYFIIKEAFTKKHGIFQTTHIERLLKSIFNKKDMNIGSGTSLFRNDQGEINPGKIIQTIQDFFEKEINK